MHRRAFTLLEVTIVVVILATAALIATPRLFGTTSRARLQAAAQRFAQDVEATRERARTLGVYQTMCFSGTGYTIMQRTPSTEEKVTVVLADDPYRSQIGYVSLKSGSELSFDAFGVPSSSALVKITNGNDSYYVTINAGSGATGVSGRTSSTAAAAIDASVTPTGIAVNVAAINPLPRVSVDVRFDANGTNLATTVTSIIDALGLP
ncbi:MAG: type II secretion system protein [Phycisphaerales bacterium]